MLRNGDENVHHSKSLKSLKASNSSKSSKSGRRSSKSSSIMHKVYDLKGSTHKRQATRHKFILDKRDFTAMNAIENVTTESAQEILQEVDEDKLDEEQEETLDNYDIDIVHHGIHQQNVIKLLK